MSNKYVYSDEQVEVLVSTVGEAGSTVTEEQLQSLIENLGYPRRSVAAKLRKMGYEVPTTPKAVPTFNAEESEYLASYIADNHGVFTAEELAQHFTAQWGRSVSAAQVTGKILSLNITGAVKPAEKKVAPKTFTEEEAAVILSSAEKGRYIEEVAAELGKTVNQVRGKALSMGVKLPQRDKVEAKVADYSGLDVLAPTMTVAELAVHFGKTERGVKTVLSRRNLAAKDYTPKPKAA